MRSRGFFFWASVLFGVSLALGIVAFSIILTIAVRSEPSQVTEALIAKHPGVEEFVGSPINIPWLRSVKLHSTSALAASSVVVDVEGPRGDIRAQVLLVQPSGQGPWQPFFAAIVDTHNRPSKTLKLDPGPAEAALTRGLRESAARLPGRGSLDFQLDGDQIRLTRGDL